MPKSTSAPLHVNIDGHEYDIPAPSAALGYATTTILTELERAKSADEQPDTDMLNNMLTELGFDKDMDPTDEILPRPLRMKMLRELNVDQMRLAMDAVMLWVLSGREAAEAYLADPTGAPEPEQTETTKKPQDHKAKQPRSATSK